MTQEQKDYVDKHYKTKLRRELSTYINVEPVELIKYCIEMGYDSPNKKEMKLQEVYLLFQKHPSASQIAEITGYSITVIFTSLDFLGLSKAKQISALTKKDFQSANVKNYGFKLSDKQKKAVGYVRPPAIYTQSGSDYLDKQNGITTTIRNDKLSF